MLSYFCPSLIGCSGCLDQSADKRAVPTHVSKPKLRHHEPVSQCEKPALTSQWWSPNFLLLVFHTERSAAGVKTNRCVIHKESCAVAPNEVWRYTSCWRLSVFKVFPRCPPVSLNLLAVNNQKCDEKSVGQTGRQTAPHTAAVFISS